MSRLLIYAAALVAVAGLAIVGCAPAQPAPTPTKAPSAPTTAAEPTKAAAPAPAPTKPAEPTKAVAAPPTVAPAKKADFPAKDRAISIIVPWGPGGGADISARALAPLLEKELGAPVQVVNRAGAGSQTGLTEAARARPDGYTMLQIGLPSTNIIYLDPERKAAFGRKDFEPVAMQVVDPGALGVEATSPYKTLKDLIDAAKAKPEAIKVSTTAVKGTTHLAILQIAKEAGVKFSIVHFNEGTVASMPAILGGHVDAGCDLVSSFMPQVKSGRVRVLGVMDREESKFLPGAKTMMAQGVNVYWVSSRGYVVPSGTPKEVVDVLGSAMKKAMESEEHKKKLEELSQTPRYMDAARMAAEWEQADAQVIPMLEMAKE